MRPKVDRLTVAAAAHELQQEQSRPAVTIPRVAAALHVRVATVEAIVGDRGALLALLDEVFPAEPG